MISNRSGETVLAARHLIARGAGSAENGEIIGERYFYCSRFCNAGFTVLALVPVKEGTLFLYGNRFWIDYWSGIPRLKHRFGQRVMSGSMEERIEREEICK